MVAPEPTQDELLIFDDISRVAGALWTKSKKVTALSTDPRMFSVMLFRRLWSNHRGFTILWNNGLPLEADIVLRSGIEAAICLAANFRLRDAFVRLMRQDAAFTLQGQIKLHRQVGEQEMVREAEAALRDLQRKSPGDKAQRLDWQLLAEHGHVAMLYSSHRMLSGISSHVTGMSVLRGVVGADGDGVEQQVELSGLTRKMRLMMMAGATLNGAMHHAGMLDDLESLQETLSLTERLNTLSWRWPGVQS